MLNVKMRELELENEECYNEDQSDSDGDLCGGDELEGLFPNCELTSEVLIHNNKNYVLYLDGTNETSPNIVTGLSDYKCAVYNVHEGQIGQIVEFPAYSNSVIGVKFSHDNKNLIYAGCNDTINLWDIRTPDACVSSFTDTTDQKKEKVFTCFDLSCDDRLLTAGTDVFEGDAFLLFWDVRNVKLMGGYWESHTDDVTQVKFHPTDRNKLVSGSTDGLINVYNLSESNEDDALTESLNTESSVQRLSWFHHLGRDGISCITHTEDLQYWRIDDAAPYVHFRRGDVANGLKRKSSYPYLVNTHETKSGICLIAGSNSSDGSCLRGLTVSGKSLLPGFSMPNNKQRVRSSWFSKNHNILVTGGEKGYLNVWTIKGAALANMAKTKK